MIGLLPSQDSWDGDQQGRGDGGDGRQHPTPKAVAGHLGGPQTPDALHVRHLERLPGEHVQGCRECVPIGADEDSGMRVLTSYHRGRPVDDGCDLDPGQVLQDEEDEHSTGQPGQGGDGCPYGRQVAGWLRRDSRPTRPTAAEMGPYGQLPQLLGRLGQRWPAMSSGQYDLGRELRRRFAERSAPAEQVRQVVRDHTPRLDSGAKPGTHIACAESGPLPQ